MHDCYRPVETAKLCKKGNKQEIEVGSQLIA
jgi:hypothetical protein